MQIFIISILAVLAMQNALADILTQNASSASGNDTAFAAWPLDVGVTRDDIEFFVDFEIGFIEGDNVSGVAGLFPGGLVIIDASSADATIICGPAANIGGSNPIDTLAVTQNEQPFLELGFSERPVD